MKGNKKTKLKSIITFIVMIAIIAGSVFTAYFGLGEGSLLSMKHIRLGLDLQGGVNIVYEAAIDDPTNEDMHAALEMIRTRLDKENYTEAEATIEGTNRIRVDIPGVKDPQKAVTEIAATAMLTFNDEEGNVIVSGKNVDKAEAAIVTNELNIQEPIVSIEFDKEGTKMFSKFTKENIGKPIIIKLDDTIISVANIQNHITDGKGMISGGFTAESAKQLADRIEAGALPFALNPISTKGVGAKLGMDAFNTSLKAGAIGMVIILIFMLIIYRLSGFAADLALTFYVALVLMILSRMEATLTLPGIAGIILSIGMAVDANVIIFTRIKEEYAAGRSVRAAIDAGFGKAFSAILDGNVTTLIASGVLYMLGTGLIKSFALTLGIGIVISMFTALVITRVLIKSLVGMGLKSPGLYGMKKSIEERSA